MGFGESGLNSYDKRAYSDVTSNRCLRNDVFWLYFTVWVKKSPLRFSDIFSQTVWHF